MRSIRTRLTIAYATALIGTLVLLAMALYSARRVTVMSGLEERLNAEADQTVRIIEIARDLFAGQLIVTPDSLIGTAISPRVVPLLDLLPDYVIVKDVRGFTLYASEQVRALSVDQRDKLDSSALRMRDGGAPVRVSLLRHELLVVSRAMNKARSTSVDRVWVGIDMEPAENELRQFLSTFIIISPFLVALSLAFAHGIAGRAFRPIDRIIDQVEAITDGRSLHRRLAIGAAGGELARLSSTLNAMIERLETSFGALRRFTADASHELKTPLTVLRADVERAMSPRSSRGDKAVALEEALQQVTQMADLVDSLLTLARADEGRFDLYREPVELAPLVREVVETARLLGEEAGLTIEANEIDDAVVQGDRTRLRQLFLNLVTNAIKYTPRRGRVELMLTCTADQAQFLVKDTGIGIAAADLPYVFERFWRADRVRSRTEGGGFGLGLAIAQWIAQAHGGTLTVKSRLTRGTTFTVTLPIGGPGDVDEPPSMPVT